MSRTVLGHSVQRREDGGLLTGTARYVDDIALRVERAVGRVRAFDARPRELTSVDAAAARRARCRRRVHGHRPRPSARPRDGRRRCARPALARDRSGAVRRRAGRGRRRRDACAGVRCGRARRGRPGAAASRDRRARGAGARRAVALPRVRFQRDHRAAAATGRRVGRRRGRRAGPLRHHRVAPVPMEPNGCVVVPEGERLTVWASTQSVFGVHARSPACSGSTRTRVRCARRWSAVVSARRVACTSSSCWSRRSRASSAAPIAWVETRAENLLEHDARTRRRCTTSRSARRATARSSACASRPVADVGAYPIRGTFIPMVTRFMASGCYRIPEIEFAR